MIFPSAVTLGPNVILHGVVVHRLQQTELLPSLHVTYNANNDSSNDSNDINYSSEITSYHTETLM